ncbi:MAG: Crp/Fnr family transcriptional regulator [Microscillaceae bacterium]
MQQSGIWFFDDVNLFDFFCPHRLKEYQGKHTFKEYQKGEYIYYSQDPANKIFLVVEGKVKISFCTPDGREISKMVLESGEMFGELALFGVEQRNDTAQAISEKTVLCPLDVETMHELMRTYRTFSFKVYKTVGTRIEKMERKIESLIAKDVKTRLLEFLCEMAHERGRKAGTETLVMHSLTQKDIADLIGTSRQTVTTLLNEFKEQNLIYFDRKRILIRDLQKLSNLISA